jgi:Ca2+:H+ antiporter
VEAARRDEMTLAVEIAVGSSAQIALFVAPIVILDSFAIGRPMSLLFIAFEIAAIALSVVATSMVVTDGESNWVEGLQLISVYLVLAIAFYFVP